jgi:MscS family membrane protein
LAGIHLAILILSIDGALSWRFAQILRYTYYFTITVIFVWTVYRLIEVFVIWYEDVCRARQSGMQQFMPLVRQTLRIFVIIIGVITILSALDIDVGGFIAGLGIGGIAVALAAKDSLGNFFGSVGIIADRPFQVGDWVMIGSKWEGFVEEIGFRSTKIRTWPRTLLTIPNQALANEVIDNLSKMPKRRVKTTIGITYETPLEKIEPFVEAVQKILQEDPGVHKEFILVRFHQFGDSSLDILMIYFTIGIRGHDYYGTQQRVNLKIMHKMNEMGISMAYPTQSLHIESFKKMDTGERI